MIGPYTEQQYYDRVLAFHGHAAPGVLLGGFMVSAARERIPEGVLFDVVCESAQCLPDAVQILTPCTVGNGWLRVFDHNVFAVVLYDKVGGDGCRAWLDPARLENFPGTREWFYKLRPKKNQDGDALRREIMEHGAEMISTRPVRMHPDALRRQGKGAVGNCPSCGEAYATRDGAVCPLCAGARLYDFV